MSNDLSLLAAELRAYVRQYSNAEELIPEKADLMLPRTQIRGQLLELALKAYIVGRGVENRGHDLVELAGAACNLGLELSEKQRDDYIPRLNEVYYLHTGRQHKYLSRYPDPNPRLGVWILPDRTPFRAMIDIIVEQTKASLTSRK